MEAEIEKKKYFVLRKSALHYRQIETKLSLCVEGACKLKMGKN